MMKKCKVCNEKKKIVSFPKLGSKACKSCVRKRRKLNKLKRFEERNRIENIIGIEGMVKVSHINGNWESLITLEEAQHLFKIGCAEVKNGEAILFKNRRNLTDYILKRDGGKCVYCGKKADTLDHVVAVSRGGIDIPSNTAASCEACNHKKQSKTLEEFLREDPKREAVFKNSAYYINHIAEDENDIRKDDENAAEQNGS